MRKKWKRIFCTVLSVSIIFTSSLPITAAEAAAGEEAPEAVSAGEENTAPEKNAAAEENADTVDALAETQGAEPSDTQNADTSDTGEEPSDSQTEDTPETGAQGEDDTSRDGNISGTVTVETPDISGTVTVESDKNDDNVEIKENDKPYLALGVDLTAEQQATVLALMGIDAGRLDSYDVMYVNNTEEHQYLDSYIDSSKIGTRSLSSIVIVERKDGNGINISTHNISYCTVGMYKNALATAGIEDADIIVAAPFAISGTAALVGIFKAYKEMTGDEIDEENIDTALHELVLTGNLESANGADSDDVEALIAYVKQAVVEHDMSDESEIRKAIAEGCKEFNVELTEEEIDQIVELMLKISQLDLDLDSLLNSAQSIYDKIKNAGDSSGFFAKIGNWISNLIEKIMSIFS